MGLDRCVLPGDDVLKDIMPVCTYIMAYHLSCPRFGEVFVVSSYYTSIDAPVYEEGIITLI